MIVRISGKEKITKGYERNLNMTTETKLTVIDGETLMDMKLPPTKFCVETLLPQGICMLGGAPKIGKSWMVLDLCIRIAKGESIWNLPTKQGTTLSGRSFAQGTGTVEYAYR